MRNYNHYLRYIKNGIKLVFEENKNGSLCGIHSYKFKRTDGWTKTEWVDYFLMNGNWYKAILYEYGIPNDLQTFFEVYRVKLNNIDTSDFMPQPKLYYYCTKPVKGKGNFKVLYKYINDWLKETTGYKGIFYRSVDGSKVPFNELV